MSPRGRAARRSSILCGAAGQTLGPRSFDEQEAKGREAWQQIIDQGMYVSVPETVVEHAWRALIVHQHEIGCGADELQRVEPVPRQYANESGDAIRSLALWGHSEVAR